MIEMIYQRHQGHRHEEEEAAESRESVNFFPATRIGHFEF